MTDEFLADECETKFSTDGKLVKIIFRNDDGEEKEIILYQRNIPQFVASLHNEKNALSPPPSSLLPGDNFRPAGFQIKNSADGGCVLIASLELYNPIRTVTIPLEFSAKDLEILFSMIVGKQTLPSN